LQVSEDVSLAEFAASWDGEPLREGGGRLKLAPGPHEIRVAVALESTQLGARPVQVALNQPVVVPGTLSGQKGVAGGAMVHVVDRGGGGPLSARLEIRIEATPFAVFVPSPGTVMLAPKVGGQQRLSDFNEHPHRPLFPLALRGRRFQMWALYKVCVDSDGVVKGVTTMKAADETGPIDAQWKAAIRTWQHRPHMVDGHPVGFCYPWRVQVSDRGVE
jgi:hypothetical protein